jgi:hypothetical protein
VMEGGVYCMALDYVSFGRVWCLSCSREAPGGVQATSMVADFFRKKEG